MVKLKKNDIQKRMKENQEKNNFTVKKFEESIEIVNENFPYLYIILLISIEKIRS